MSDRPRGSSHLGKVSGLQAVQTKDISIPHWVCVRSEPNREFFAEANLLRRDFEVYCPRFERMISHARKKVLVLRPFFPNYLFVRSAAGLIGLGDVKRTPGVSSLAARDLHSALVPDPVIAALRARENESGHIQLSADRFRAGETVRLSRGPFVELEAVFAEKHDDRRCRILLSMLGKQHSVIVLSDHLEKIA